MAQEFHAARVEAIRQIFDLLLAQVRQQGRLREGLDPAVLRTYFIASVVNVLEHPDLTALGLSPAEIYATVKAIFLHGILCGD